MSAIEVPDQSFDSSFDAFLQAPTSNSSPSNHHLVATSNPHSPATSSSLSHARSQDGAPTTPNTITTAADAFGGLDAGEAGMRPSSSGGNLHLNISNLSVNNSSEHDLFVAQHHHQHQHQHQHQTQPSGYPLGGLSHMSHQRLQNDFMLGGGGAAGPAASSPHSVGASPSSDVHGAGMPPSPSFHANGTTASAGSPASKPAQGPMGGRASNAASRSFGEPSTKREPSVPTLGTQSDYSQQQQQQQQQQQSLGMPNLAAEGDVSVDDPQLLGGQTEADLAAEKRQSSKFVYKLFRMVSDQDYQHLISWNRNGTSVMVCNFDEFAKEVLGKHFKHSNFSSFIRQLNMYGFYKVNKTPRGHRQSVDTQIWEFSHPKFLRGRPDLLDDIRRKALDSEHARVEARDLQYSVSVGQMQLRQQVEEMSYRLDDLTEQNAALRSFSVQLRDVLGVVLEHIKKSNGGQVPFDVRIPTLEMPSPMPPSGMWTPQLHENPPIFVTEPEFGLAGQQPRPFGAGNAADPSMFAAGVGQDPFSMSAPGSRRVSHGSNSAHGHGAPGGNEALMAMRHGSLSDQGMMPPPPQRSASFEGQMLPPQYGGHRPSFSKAPLAGLAIDTSAAAGGGPLFPNHQVHQGISPTSSQGGLMAANAGFGPLSMPPSPLTPQHQAMFAAINTPLPPSPAPNAMNGGQFGPFDPTSPYLQGNGFVQPPFSAGTHEAGFFFGGGGGGEGDGPNAKAMRTPLKRTASNSGPSQHGTPVLVQQAGMQGPLVSPGLMKRKSPV
ncbi:uncharacterized protein PFL1_05375 [Pseudozyma flocculosa PF-1]|uniref:Related to Heat shock factor protein 4 n=2 Tax=Pseudozyma flocculosa TaxID=84751 RepID=A0A5C3FCZ7_9BASI|nr:uncharacterized protein PFL1_05375 [Pseudozyma flocculosa PF-1]EPQ27091.1 hypothetical protein PFL1_05375 [Pseudozyma flocculosa PF-1]SPO41341.1 related to Heat shock factor protein 4 [Pseudozyma flocculosa]